MGIFLFENKIKRGLIGIFLFLFMFQSSITYGLLNKYSNLFDKEVELFNKDLIDKDLFGNILESGRKKNQKEQTTFLSREEVMQKMREKLDSIEEEENERITIEIEETETEEIVEIVFEKDKGNQGKLLIDHKEKLEQRGLFIEEMFYDILVEEVEYGVTSLFFDRLLGEWKDTDKKIETLEVEIEEQNEGKEILIRMTYYKSESEESGSFDLRETEEGESVFQISPKEYKRILDEKDSWDKLKHLKVTGNLKTGQIGVIFNYIKGIDERELSKSGIIALEMKTIFKEVEGEVTSTAYYKEEVRQLNIQRERLEEQIIDLLKNREKTTDIQEIEEEGTLGDLLKRKLGSFRLRGEEYSGREVGEKELENVLVDEKGTNYLIFKRKGKEKTLYDTLLKGLILSETKEILLYEREGSGEIMADFPGSIKLSEGKNLIKKEGPIEKLNAMGLILDQGKDDFFTTYRYVKLGGKEIEIEEGHWIGEKIKAYMRLGIIMGSKNVKEKEGFGVFGIIDLVRYLEHRMNIPMRKNFNESLDIGFALNSKYEGQYVKLEKDKQDQWYLGISGVDEREGLEPISVLNYREDRGVDQRES